MIDNRHHDLISALFDSDLSFGDQIRFLVVSDSMAPMFKTGDALIATVISPEIIQSGDILVTRRKNDFLTHRAIKSIDGGWQTKGDNTVLFDPPSKFNDIIGRVVTIQKEKSAILLQTKKWDFINHLLAKLSGLEAQAYSLYPMLRLPFRASIKFIQNFLF